MSELKATPGEWLKVDGQAFVYALNEDGINRFWMSINPGRTAGGGRVSREEIDANAHLMRSAKELYEALVAFERVAELWLPPNDLAPEHYGEGEALCGLHREMLDALAKARGSS